MGVAIVVWAAGWGATARLIGAEDLAEALATLVAFAVEGVAGACWVPAVAGPVTFGVFAVVAGSEESSLAISAALSLTGLGTGYSFGIDPSCAYVYTLPVASWSEM